MKAIVKSKTLVVFLAMALGVILAFGALGCSNDDSSTENDTSAQDETSTTEQTDEAESNGEMTLIEDGKLTVASDFGFPPFEYMDGENKVGFSVELVEALCEEMGLEPNWTDPMKFDTLIPQVSQHTKIDAAVASITITDERLQEVDFTDPYLDSNQALTVMKDSGYTSEDDLNASDKKIGVQSGTSGEAWAVENLPEADIVPLDDVPGAFSAMQAGQVDAVVVDLPVTNWMVKESYPDCETIEEIPTGEQYGIAVSKENPELTKQLNDALQAIKDNGTYQEIHDKYFKVD